MTPVLPLKICWKDKTVWVNSNIQFISLMYVSVARQNNIFIDIYINFCHTSHYLLSYYIHVSRNQIFIKKFDDILKYQKKYLRLNFKYVNNPCANTLKALKISIFIDNFWKVIVINEWLYSLNFIPKNYT